MPKMTAAQIQVRQGTLERKINCPPDSLCNDLQIRALGRWNEQGASAAITRRNGFASYSLLKAMMTRRIGC